jgi:hypothetical protein
LRPCTRNTACAGATFAQVTTFDFVFSLGWSELP